MRSGGIWTSPSSTLTAPYLSPLALVIVLNFVCVGVYNLINMLILLIVGAKMKLLVGFTSHVYCISFLMPSVCY